MNETFLEAFRHGAWASKTLIAACRSLSADQLEHPVRGFGSILATLNHVVLCDGGYAAVLTGTRAAWARGGNDTDDLDQMEARVDETTLLWERFLAAPLDEERRLVLESGAYECPASVVVAQVLHHGAAHREQVRAALAELGIKPPDLQPWAYADDTGRARWLRAKS
jgi:uncharacterized damage-inducible protein DinB